jgi:amino acid permease
VIPTFTAVDFVSFYIEIPVMLVMFIFWMLLKHPGLRYGDLVDVKTVDLSRDEYTEGDQDRADDEERDIRMKGSKGYLWRLYYWIV